MDGNVRHEEVTVLGDFLLTSYTRDLDAIKSKFPKLGETFRDGFIAKLNFVKTLESSLILSEDKKGVTASLYNEADRLDKELNFLSSYFKDAGLNTAIISAVKADLHNANIEGAILKLEGLCQFVAIHVSELTAEGMASDYATVLGDYKVSLTKKNKDQNDLLNARKQLTNANVAHYKELLQLIRKITNKGTLVFKNTVIEDEYVFKKVLQRMRVAKRKAEAVSDNAPIS